MQHTLRAAIVGDKFWNRQQKKRAKMTAVNNKRIDDPNSINEIIQAIFGMGVYQNNSQFGEDNWFQNNDDAVEEKGPVVLVSGGVVKVYGNNMMGDVRCV